jgi:hypothetical protein
MLAYLKNKLVGKSLVERMQNNVNIYNNKQFDSYYPRVISLKSKEILKLVNNLGKINNEIDIKNKLLNWKQYNKIILNVSKECYDRFNPSMIYSFNDEIHMVFYNQSDYEIYNNNINKTLTIMTSFVSNKFTKEFIKNNIDVEFTVYGKYVEFKDEYEVLNYLIWRQFDCKRNNIITLYKCINSNVDSMSLDNITQELFHYLSDDLNISYEDIQYIICGNILKKRKYHNKSTSYFSKTRKELQIINELLHDNFRHNLKKYILNNYLLSG